MSSFRIETYLKIIFLISLISITSAYFIEYGLGHQPCKLCLIERIPYVLGMILIILNYIFRKNTYFIILLMVLTFSFSIIISLYHFGIEQNFFKESGSCGLKNTMDIISKEELLKQLQEKTISCKDVTFRILGFSLTTINIFLSLFITIILTNILTNYEKFKN